MSTIYAFVVFVAPNSDGTGPQTERDLMRSITAALSKDDEMDLLDLKRADRETVQPT